MGISGILSIFDGELDGAEPIMIREWVGPGRRAAALSLSRCSGALRGGGMVTPLSSTFGSDSFALKRYVKPTLMPDPNHTQGARQTPSRQAEAE
jgi:hypothetical protein